MLKEINCAIFREKTVSFHKGLNVILGDDVGSNSIGKSTLLMIIDFIYGGKSYIDHNSDVVTELGHHSFNFRFDFNGENFYFSRNTEHHQQVDICDEKYNITETIPIKKYCEFLKKKYDMTINLGFRTAISLYSRIWGKHNLDVKRPLHTFPKEKNAETVQRFLLLLNEYNDIIDVEKRLKKLKESQVVIKKAEQFEHIPKITKTRYDKNNKEVLRLEAEIANLKTNIQQVTLELTEQASKELLELQNRKNELIRERDYYKSRLIRISSNTLLKKNELKFEKLLEFFPEVNLTRLQNIEDFHEGLTKLLGEEIRSVKKEHEQQVKYFNDQIEIISGKINTLLDKDEQPNFLIEKFINLAHQLSIYKLENNYYDKAAQVKADIDETNETLSSTKEKILQKVMDVINTELNLVNNDLHTEKRRAPELTLEENDYDYKIFDNTGTGKAYTNLVILDLSVFKLTELPIVIHDSVLFKNIENSVVENIILMSKKFEKQVFIAIDEIHKYSEETQKILLKYKVIQLTKDKLLFIKDWRG